MNRVGIRAIVTADWHADAVTAGEDRFEDVRDAAMTIVKHAIDSHEPGNQSLFVFAGDLTNPDPPRCWRAAQLAAKVAKLLELAGIRSVWLTGNHDVLEDGFGSHSLMFLDQGISSWCRVASEPGMLEVGGDTRVLCLPYVPRSHAYDPVEVVRLYRDQPPPALVVGHLMIEGISVGSETKDFARGRDIFLPIAEIQRQWPGVPIVNGHYHAGQVFKGVHIPGSVARFTLGEAGNEPRFLEFDL